MRFRVIVFGLAGTVLSLAIPAYSQYRNDCYSLLEIANVTYCVFTKDKGSAKEIIVSTSGGRQSPTIVTYVGTSFTPGGRFTDDVYPDRGPVHVLRYFGPDKIVLQEECASQSECPARNYRR